MITIKIGDIEQEWDRPGAVSESWVNQQIARRRAAGENPCVRLRITTPSVKVALTSSGCPAGGGGRRATPEEERIFMLWAERGLNDAGFAPGNLIAFLRQLDRIL